ncbi:hypothetical protein PUNSTDRAFT_41254 [Punctularia strigosozonata HHB-11173 SS5]|uniref:uncharacterized protein n=1 Tax=Punctularia strigosozonata (strain HHB-11173) TaxID=741275 RepID=UPI0004417943|nr:uncharacterized protein PUNSTDRAFT_41254 [Punctularia strigosozonata HHB-11173 SS5]EIN13813.1 hypothetical protein PUNSTDRAFT_41254 [Punctularia strigosozonata HHB-11173 SS5]
MPFSGHESPSSWVNGQLVEDFNFDGQPGEDFDADIMLHNIDFGVYVGCSFSPVCVNGAYREALAHVSANLVWQPATRRVNKPLVIEEFGMTGLSNKSSIYPIWVHIMPWQWGELGLTESKGNRIIKYADAILDGASPNDGFAFYRNQTAVWDIFTRAAEMLA